EGLTNVLSYVRENENFENEIKYLNNLHVFFVNNFQILSKYYLYLTNREFSGNENIIEEKNVIIAKIEEYLSNLDENFGAIRELWEKFYDNFTSFYVENHNEFYSNPLFKKRQTIEQSREFKTLYKISSIVNSGIFENDYYSLRRYFEKLPSPCREDLNRELFVNPVCRCGYKYGKEITCDNEDDIPGICRSGIINFIKFLQEGQTREKIESYLLSNPEKNELSSKIRNLLNLSCEKINLDLLMNDLSDEILKEIEYSLKNNFKVKEVKIKDILGKISNRKIKYADLKKIFFEWAGADEEAIIFIKEENDNKLSQIGETLKKYKQSGDKILTTLTGENNLSEEKIEKIFSEINLNSFNSLELLNLLKEEENKILLRKIRSELFDKISGKYITEDFTKNITDKHFLEITNILKLSYSDTNYKGIDYFTEVISPFNLALEKLKEQNSNEDYFDYPTITKLENLYKEKKVYYKNLSNKYENALPLETLKEKIKDVVVVFDCLRYDLYLLLKESILKTGANIYEKSYRVEIPTTTANFRKLLNIENETGTIGSRTYILEKFAEKNINKRNLKKIATLEKDVKFLHFNFIDAKIHSSTINLFSLYSIIKNEFETDILPLLNELPSYYLISDHGFVDNETLQDRYTHGGNSDFETILPAVCVKNRMI
ncbi:MAG TPA: hypothetical protein PLO89_02610, partial [Spirochaetota bacterium]|nr:hypothetical protein [Spirochaetota bacterium]